MGDDGPLVLGVGYVPDFASCHTAARVALAAGDRLHQFEPADGQPPPVAALARRLAADNPGAWLAHPLAGVRPAVVLAAFHPKPLTQAAGRVLLPRHPEPAAPLWQPRCWVDLSALVDELAGDHEPWEDAVRRLVGTDFLKAYTGKADFKLHQDPAADAVLAADLVRTLGLG